MYGTPERTQTVTLKAADPKSAVSVNSTTGACGAGNGSRIRILGLGSQDYNRYNHTRIVTFRLRHCYSLWGLVHAHIIRERPDNWSG